MSDSRPVRFPLYAKIALWAFLNLFFLAVVFYALFRVQFRLGLDSLLAGRAGDRIQAVSEVVLSQLRQSRREAWNDLLEEFSSAYQVDFYLFQNNGIQIGGKPVVPPPEVLKRLAEYRAGPPANFRRARPGSLHSETTLHRASATNAPGRRQRHAAARPPHPKFMVRTSDPTRYWVLVHLPPIPGRPREAQSPIPPSTLLAVSDSIRGAGLFFDYVPWLAVGSGVLALSILFWFPLVRGITRSITQMTDATGQIAEGRFDVRIQTMRQDELGLLAGAINQMAARLAGFVSGQKRFLGDIAHELCSPIARVQMAAGILEQRAGKEEKAYVEDLREEIQEMSSLVNELLSFSKAGLVGTALPLQPVQLAPLLKRVLAREAAGVPQIHCQLDPELQALADPELLARALANLIRNALRYAGDAGPITISGANRNGQVLLTIADSGPGVPEQTLQQIFDPFFRLESSRSRDTGGVGLGLAIVKTCIEACGGTVTANRRHPSGLQVQITLNPANKTDPESKA